MHGNNIRLHTNVFGIMPIAQFKVCKVLYSQYSLRRRNSYSCTIKITFESRQIVIAGIVLIGCFMLLVRGKIINTYLRVITV